MELGIRIKKQCRNLKSSGGKVESSGSGGKVVAYRIAQVKKQLEDFPELAKRDVKELDWVKKKILPTLHDD